ncbi:hypothetical protein A2U01_0064047, partial [Trifolium medium]|nr:hypothetical protein [Trifolium medium]
MEARVEALETTLAAVQKTMSENHASLIALMERSLGKSVSVDEPSAAMIANNGPGFQPSPDPTQASGSSRLQGDSLTEFRQSVKRVELPA